VATTVIFLGLSYHSNIPVRMFITLTDIDEPNVEPGVPGIAAPDKKDRNLPPQDPATATTGTPSLPNE